MSIKRILSIFVVALTISISLLLGGCTEDQLNKFIDGTIDNMVVALNDDYDVDVLYYGDYISMISGFTYTVIDDFTDTSLVNDSTATAKFLVVNDRLGLNSLTNEDYVSIKTFADTNNYNVIFIVDDYDVLEEALIENEYMLEASTYSGDSEIKSYAYYIDVVDERYCDNSFAWTEADSLNLADDDLLLSQSIVSFVYIKTLGLTDDNTKTTDAK